MAPARLRKVRRDKRVLQASYDAAITSESNARYWRAADALSADEANSLEVRETLRTRSRYHCHEADPVMQGIVHTLANDVIGTGPRLQMLIPGQPELNRLIEQKWAVWSRRIKLAKKLRLMELAEIVDGEAFAQVVTNRKLGRYTPITLDFKVIECDRVTSPSLDYNPYKIDGIDLDELGEPETYHVLEHHPGGAFYTYKTNAVSAADMIHAFRQDRPEQHRGVPQTTTAMPLAALRRDYLLAVLNNARSSAKFTGVLETAASQVNDDGEAFDPDVESFDMVDIDYDMLTSLPHGWHLKQFTPGQPLAVFEMFMKVITAELGRCILMPHNVTGQDSSDHNYASGRLDHQGYFHAIEVRRSDRELITLDRMLEHWFDEALLIENFLPSELAEFFPEGEIPHTWFWDNRGHVDPQKEANAAAIKIKSGQTHRARVYAEEGLDVDVEDQRAAESFGMTVERYRTRVADATFGPVPAPPGDEGPGASGKEGKSTGKGQAASGKGKE